MNPAYRKEFMMKFGPNVTHILDCPESNKEEYARSKAFQLSQMIKQICPLLVPVSDRDFTDHKLNKRTEMEATLRKEKEDIKLLHTEIGLVYQLYGTVCK